MKQIQPDEQFMASIEEQIGIVGTARDNFRVDITSYMFSKLRRGEKVRLEKLCSPKRSY
jgi:serine protein kinase